MPVLSRSCMASAFSWWWNLPSASNTVYQSIARDMDYVTLKFTFISTVYDVHVTVHRVTLTEVFLNLTEVHFTLTEFFPCFFLSCKANARVKLAKTGHAPHSSQLGDNFYAVSSSLIVFWPQWIRIPEGLPTKVVNCVVLCTVCVEMCTVLLPPGVNPIAVNKYIISYVL